MIELKDEKLRKIQKEIIDKVFKHDQRYKDDKYVMVEADLVIKDGIMNDDKNRGEIYQKIMDLFYKCSSLKSYNNHYQIIIDQCGIKYNYEKIKNFLEDIDKFVYTGTFQFSDFDTGAQVTFKKLTSDDTWWYSEGITLFSEFPNKDIFKE